MMRVTHSFTCNHITHLVVQQKTKSYKLRKKDEAKPYIRNNALRIGRTQTAEAGVLISKNRSCPKKFQLLPENFEIPPPTICKSLALHCAEGLDPWGFQTHTKLEHQPQTSYSTYCHLGRMLYHCIKAGYWVLVDQESQLLVSSQKQANISYWRSLNNSQTWKMHSILFIFLILKMV